MKLFEVKTSSIFQDGKEYVLTQEAYRDGEEFTAMAICLQDTADEDGWQTAYRVNWEIIGEDEKESIMKKKDYEFKMVIADVYGVTDDYVIYAYANTMEEAIEEVKEKLSMAERLVAIEEVREF